MPITGKQTELKHEVEKCVHDLRLMSGRLARAGMPLQALAHRQAAATLERTLQTQLRMIVNPESQIIFDLPQNCDD